MFNMLKHESEDLSCQIATLVHNKYLIKSFGIDSCNINYKEGDLIEKLIVKSLMDFGHTCDDFPKCYARVEFEDINIILKPKVHECQLLPELRK